MIVQISYNPDKVKKDFKSSLCNLTISEFEKEELEILKTYSPDIKLKTFTNGRTILYLKNVQVQKLLDDLKTADEEKIFNEINNSYLNFNNYDSLRIKIGDKSFSKPLIMGILNVTPDSFSDGGKYFDKDSAVKYAFELIENGADIIDIGGESTRPGSDPVSVDEELNRVIPVIEEILKSKPDALISVDTTKSKVAEEACKRGVKIINDISGLTFDKQLALVAAKYSASLIIMHIKGTPKTMQQNIYYDDLIFDIYEFLYHQTKLAESAGVKNIFVDPGIGFGKTAENNFEIIKRLEDFKSLGYPVLVGLSRKSFLGKTLNLDINNRDNATVVAETIALVNGAKIIRTHNVINAFQAEKVLNFIYN